MKEVKEDLSKIMKLHTGWLTKVLQKNEKLNEDVLCMVVIPLSKAAAAAWSPLSSMPTGVPR